MPVTGLHWSIVAARSREFSLCWWLTGAVSCGYIEDLLRTMSNIKQEIKTEEEQQNYSMSNNSDPKNMQELTQYVQTLLQGMQDKFQAMSDQIITRIDEMGNRIDDLEKNITELMTQAGVEGPEK